MSRLQEIIGKKLTKNHAHSFISRTDDDLRVQISLNDCDPITSPIVYESAVLHLDTSLESLELFKFGPPTASSRSVAHQLAERELVRCRHSGRALITRLRSLALAP